MRNPKHDLSYDEFETLMTELVVSGGGNYDNKFIEKFCQYILSPETIDAIICDLEDYFEGTEWEYDDDWESYIDDDGNLLPEYENDEYIKHIVATEGWGDYIYKVTGVEPEDGF